MTATTMTRGGDSSWIQGNRKLIAWGAAVLIALVLALWLFSGPAKIEPFTIGEGQGINAHVSYDKAIDLAEQNNLPIYMGQGWNEANRISYADARSLADDLAKTQVTVRVQVGDHFDADGRMTR